MFFVYLGHRLPPMYSRKREVGVVHRKATYRIWRQTAFLSNTD